MSFDVSHISNCVPFLFASLATAGYGTALGVIRALHSEGVLERAYCSETRPFNQVSLEYSTLVRMPGRGHLL